MTFDIATARLCLKLSGLAYEDDPGPALRGLGLRLVNRYDKKGTQAFLATDGKRLLLANCGSNEFIDFFNDARYVKTDFRPVGTEGGRVHAGFYDAFKAVRPAIASDLKKPRQRGKTLITTGHSLGGPLAKYEAVTFKAAAVYVFGSPRAGNGAFAERLEKQCPVFRFENRFDPVTMVPPATSPIQAWVSWRQDRPVTLYRHAGDTVTLWRLFHRFFRYEKSVEEYLASLEQFPRP